MINPTHTYTDTVDGIPLTINLYLKKRSDEAYGFSNQYWVELIHGRMVVLSGMYTCPDIAHDNTYWVGVLLHLVTMSAYSSQIYDEHSREWIRTHADEIQRIIRNHVSTRPVC